MRTNKIEFNLNFDKRPNIRNNKEIISEDNSSDNDDSNNIKDQVNIDILRNQQELEDEILKNNYEYDIDAYYEQKEKVCKNTKKETNANKPKYMENIIKNAEKNKIERMINKDKIDNKNSGPSKEVFLTEGYKKKLEELKMINIREDHSDAKKDAKKDVNLAKIFEQRRKEFNEDEPEEIKEKAKVISELLKPVQKSEAKDEPKSEEPKSREEIIQNYKEKYLQRKREREQNES